MDNCEKQPKPMLDKKYQENIVIQNFFWNDKRLNKLTDFKLEINEFQKNINIK